MSDGIRSQAYCCRLCLQCLKSHFPHAYLPLCVFVCNTQEPVSLLTCIYSLPNFNLSQCWVNQSPSQRAACYDSSLQPSPSQRAVRNLSISWTPQTCAAAARRHWQLIPALRNSRQSLSLNRDLTLTKSLLTGQRIRKNMVINGNIIPHSSSVRFCIYIRNHQWQRMMTAPYVNHPLYKEKLSSMACGRWTHADLWVFLGGGEVLLHSALKNCTLGEIQPRTYFVCLLHGLWNKSTTVPLILRFFFFLFEFHK